MGNRHKTVTHASPPRVVVAGGGIAGLTAALELAAHGCDVHLFERHVTVGGKIKQLNIAGRNIDVGPTVLTMRWVFDQVFRDVGSRLADHVSLIESETIAMHAWDDGTSLALFFDLDRSRDAIKAFAGAEEADGFLAFSKYAKEIYDYAYPTFMLSPDPGIAYMARHAGPKAMGTVLHIDPLRKMARALKTFFSDSRLQQLFARYATYYGSSPFMAPATLNLIAHVEQQGVWLPTEGMVSVASAVAGLAEKKGAEICCGKPVESIQVEAGRVVGVVLSDGAFEAADAVIYNGDVAALGAGALGTQVNRTVARPKVRNRSLAALVGALVGRTDGFPLTSHNVFFHTTPYAQEFMDIFKHGRLPTYPTVYVRAQDRDSGTQGPMDKERLFFIINAPPKGDLQPPTQGEIDTCISAAMTLFDRAGLKISFDSNTLQLFSPKDFAEQFPETGGALYGAVTHSMWDSIRRPGVRSKISGLYLAGGSVHPGAGVPMAALGGRQAATCLLTDFGLTGPSPLTGTAGGISME